MAAIKRTGSQIWLTYISERKREKKRGTDKKKFKKNTNKKSAFIE